MVNLNPVHLNFKHPRWRFPQREVHLERLIFVKIFPRCCLDECICIRWYSGWNTRYSYNTFRFDDNERCSVCNLSSRVVRRCFVYSTFVIVTCIKASLHRLYIFFIVFFFVRFGVKKRSEKPTRRDECFCSFICLLFSRNSIFIDTSKWRNSTTARKQPRLEFFAVRNPPGLSDVSMMRDMLLNMNWDIIISSAFVSFWCISNGIGITFRVYFFEVGQCVLIVVSSL